MINLVADKDKQVASDKVWVEWAAWLVTNLLPKVLRKLL